MHIHIANIGRARGRIKAGLVKNKLYLNDDICAQWLRQGEINVRLFVFICGLFMGMSCFTIANAQPQKISRVLPLCQAASAMDAGCFATVDFDAQTAADHLGAKNLAYWIEGTTLRIVARGNGDLAPDLCCTFQDRMQLLAGAPQGLWGLQYNLPSIDESVLNLSLLVDMRAVESLDYHGPKAPEATRVETLKGRTETMEIDSRNLGQKRNITIYTPPAPPPADGYPVVYMADNSVDAFAPIVEKLIVDGLVRPVLLVGVMPLAENRFHASLKAVDRMTYGFSSGGAWALSFGVTHHDLFDQVSAFAVAGSPKQDYGFAAAQGQTLYLGAGAYDYFNKQTSVFCKQARQAGLTCHYLTIYSGHDPAMWEQGLIGALQGAFPAKSKP